MSVAMGDAFDPYTHWLSLPTQRWKPTYYEILGIERSQRDKDAIISKGKKLYAEVKAKPFAGKEKEHKVLLAEIEEAVRTFASNTKRAEYDSHLAPAIGETADAKLQAAVPTALAAPKVPVASQPETTKEKAAGAPSSFAMPPMALTTVAAMATPDSERLPQSVSRPVAKAIAKSVTKSSEGAAVPLVIRTDGGMTKSLAAASAERHRRNQAKQRSFMIALSIGGILLLGGLGFMFRDQIGKSLVSTPPPPPDDPSSTNVKPVASSPEKGAPTPAENVEPPNRTGGEVEGNPELKPDPILETKPPTPESQPPPASDPPPPTPVTFSAEEAKTLAQRCQEIVAAIKSRNAAKAAEELEKAQVLAKPEGAKATVEQLAGIVGPFRAFWKAFDEAFTSLKVGDEISISATTKAKVASVSETELEIETAAGKRKQARDSLSTGLLLALVRSKLDANSPDGKLALGVFHVVDKSGNAEEGAKLLSEANASSVSVEGIKSILAAKFDFASQVTGGEVMPAEMPAEMPSSGSADEVIKSLRTALRDRNLQQMEKLQTELEKLAAAPDAKPNLAAEVELARYTQQFWGLAAKGMDSFQGLEEIKVGDEIIVVVEKGRSKLVCRVRGKRTEYTIKDIPPGLALAVVEMTSNKNSTSFKLAKGALYFTNKTPDLAKAKDAWLAAQAQGAKAADRLLTLTP
jgi:preprotein translocase subunit YajC